MAYIDPSRRPLTLFFSYALAFTFLARFFSFVTGVSLRASGWGFVGAMALIGLFAGAATWLTLHSIPDET